MLKPVSCPSIGHMTVSSTVGTGEGPELRTTKVVRTDGPNSVTLLMELLGGTLE